MPDVKKLASEIDLTSISSIFLLIILQNESEKFSSNNSLIKILGKLGSE